GVYWVATDVGVYRFNPTGGRLGNADFGLGVSDSPIPQSAIRNPQSTEPMFLAYYLNGEQKPFDATALLEDHAGVIWCGTNLGVYQLARSGEQCIVGFADMRIPMGQGEPHVLRWLGD